MHVAPNLVPVDRAKMRRHIATRVARAGLRHHPVTERRDAVSVTGLPGWIDDLASSLAARVKPKKRRVLKLLHEENEEATKSPA
jgi:hypothetical protein